MAALDMVFNAARLLSPLLLGSIYAIFAQRGQPELLFLVAGVSNTYPNQWDSGMLTATRDYVL